MTPLERSTRPGRASITEVLRLAWPLVLTNSAWTVQTVLDRALLSRDDPDSVGAGMSAVLIFWTALSFAQYTVNYATTFVAQYSGAGQSHRIGPVVGQSLWLAVAAGLFVMALSPLAPVLATLTGHEPALVALEGTYLRYLCFAAPPILINAAVGSFFAGRGDSLTMLMLGVIGLAINVPVAYVLIGGKFGFPRVGIAGAGWALILGTSASAVIGLALLCRRKYIREYNTVVGWGIDLPLMRRLLSFGLPQGVGTALETGGFTVFMILIGLLGKADLAASSIACTLNLLCFMPMLGMGQAVEVLVGKRLGAGDWRGAARSAWSGLSLSFAFTAAVALSYVLAPRLLAQPFAPQDSGSWGEVEERVVLLLRFVAVYCLFDCLTLVLAFGLRGAGDTRFVMLVSVLVCWPVMVLPAWASWYFGWGLYWAWGFASAYVCLLSLIYLTRFLQGRWKTMRVIESVNEEGERTDGQRVALVRVAREQPESVH